MKQIIVILLLLSATLSAKEPQWKNLKDGLAEAKSSGKKVLVDVYTDWCSWCKKMDATTYTDKSVSEYLSKNFVIVKLNAEGTGSVNYSGQTMTPAEFAQGMGVSGYPATGFLQSDGQAITLLPGYLDADKFIHVLTYIATDQYKTKKFQDYIQEKGVKF